MLSAVLFRVAPVKATIDNPGEPDHLLQTNPPPKKRTATMKTFCSISLLSLLIPCFGAPASGGVDIEGNLALVPASDPAPENPPKVKEALRAVHPRLLFTTEEIITLKTQIENDPILKVNADAVIRIAKTLDIPGGTPPKIFQNDTAALVTSQGKMPNLIYAYHLTKDPELKDKIVQLLEMFLENEHWAYTKELDSNMGAGNNMLAAGLLFDAVANELEPELRQALAQKLLLQARRMYYLGHQEKALNIIKYWQQDPANNHRWHRASGMAACLLSVADIEGIDSGWLLEQFKAEVDFLIKWFPHDGDCHEGVGYQVFGFSYLAITSMMMDRVLGTDYLAAPGFRNAWTQQIYSDIPGNYNPMSFGDSQNGKGKPGVFRSYEPSFFIGPRLSRDADAQAALVDWYQRRATVNGTLRPSGYPWLMLTYYDSTVEIGDAKALPPSRLFADLGVAYLRDGWGEDTEAVMMFKCGPYGGYALNEYRNTNDFHYINIAHDDPDANSIALAVDGELVIHPGRYFSVKNTEQHNTLLINGKGQIGGDTQYTQPVPNTDMTTLSYLTGWKTGDAGRVIIEGEAGNTFEDIRGFRRAVIWLPGEYALVLDSVKAEKENQIIWQAFSPTANISDLPRPGGTFVGEEGAKVPYQIRASSDLSSSLSPYAFKGRWKTTELNRTQFETTAAQTRVVCLLDPWQRGDLELKLAGDGRSLKVMGEGIADTWQWTPAEDLTTPSLISGSRNGKILIQQTSSDKAPQGD